MRNWLVSMCACLSLFFMGCGSASPEISPPTSDMNMKGPKIELTLAEVTATTGVIVIKFDEAVSFRVKLNNKLYSNPQFTSMADTVTWQFNMLSAVTTYVATVEAMDSAGNITVDFIHFTTMPQTNAAKFIDVHVVFQPYNDTFTLQYHFTLSEPARVYLYNKYLEQDSWHLVSFTNQKQRKEYFPVGPYTPGMRVYYRLAAENDDGVITDSYVSIADVPMK